MDLDFADIRWVTLSFVDVFGTSHSMQLPAERFADALEHGAVFDGSALEGRTRLAETDMRLRPDESTLVDLGDGVARAVCTVLSGDGSPWAGDPRTQLVAVLEDTEALGEQFRASAELEFYLLTPDGEPVDGSGYFKEAAGLGIDVAREAADRLRAFGVAIDSVHHEAGPGQYELDLAAAPALVLADALVFAKQTIREVAASADLRATFMPRPLEGEPGSGLHIHQMVGDLLVDGSGNLSDDGRMFVAGQLEHARGLSAFAAPTVNSYKRLHSGPEAPSAAMWAHVNRAALIRVSPNSPNGATVEFRGADPSANPYILLAALLASAADGLQNALELGPSVEEQGVGGFDPASVDSARFEMLPRDLDDALNSLMNDDVLVDAFDNQLLSRLLDGRRLEAADYRSQVTPWEIDMYLDEA